MFRLRAAAAIKYAISLYELRLRRASKRGMVRDSGGRRPAGTISSYLRARLTTPGYVGQRFGTPTAWIMASS